MSAWFLLPAVALSAVAGWLLCDCERAYWQRECKGLLGSRETAADLQEENRWWVAQNADLREQIDVASREISAARYWRETAAEQAHIIEELQDRLAKFERRRGARGRFVA